MPLPPRLPSRTIPVPGSKPAEVLANRYYVQKTLGCGNCGTALLVIDRRDKNGKDKLKVAKKIFVGNLRPDETVDANKEASLLRNLNHPNIVFFYDSFIDGAFFYIVTEYCEGGDLEERIVECKKSGRRFPEIQIVEWITEILLALQYMHSRRILHRDLKTRNLFLHHNHIKIGDFGISRILVGTMDMASTFTGTPHYMSPEVLKHEGYNSKSDIWSVGCVVYVLVSLEPAFSGKRLMDVIWQVVESSPPPWPSGFSDQLAELCYSMLNKDPVQRPSVYDALCSQLIQQHYEAMKSTLAERSRDHKEAVNNDVAKIASAVNKASKMNELRKESELKCFRYLPPRERMRIEKQKKADKEAERMKGANLLLQKMETKLTSDRARLKNDPYKSSINLGDGTAALSDWNTPRSNATTPRYHRTPAGGNSDDDDDDYDEYGRTNVRNFTESPTHQIRRSSEDYNRPSARRNLVARRSYSEFSEDRQSSDEAEDEELEQMVTNFEQCLMDETLTDHTIVADDKLDGAFGPGARENKIKNLRIEALSKLGQQKFDAIYSYLKKTRFDERLASIDEKQVIRDLRSLCSDSDLCAIVEQIVFLEVSGKG